MITGVMLKEVDLMRPPDEIDSLRSLLSDRELQRAERFVKAEHQRRFIVAHAELRKFLGENLLAQPDTLEFSEGPHGKPALDGCEFNLSHSADRALMIFHRTKAVGGDIEQQRDLKEMLDLARRFFAPKEAKWICQLDSRSRFFRLWTLKEAVMKATGEGMHLPPQEIIFNCDADLALESIRGSRDAAEEWHIAELHAAGGYKAALAIQR